jgi:hypothetical protein
MLVRGITADAGANGDRLREIAQLPASQDPLTLSLVLQAVHREALVIAYANQYVMLALMPALLLPCVWLMRRAAFSGRSADGAAPVASPGGAPH